MHAHTKCGIVGKLKEEILFKRGGVVHGVTRRMHQKKKCSSMLQQKTSVTVTELASSEPMTGNNITRALSAL